jgi:hypothetical protein
MTYRQRLTRSNQSIRMALAVLVLGVVSAPLAAMEEVTAYGTEQAIQAKAQNERFQSEMDQFVKTVEMSFKLDLRSDLRRALTPPLVLAGALADHRG